SITLPSASITTSELKVVFPALSKKLIGITIPSPLLARIW
ncbi:hypothetical protein Q604_UNBC11243G0001, partial [human gut metagenome]